MGIESEQLVFDYLSRVGDLAHGTAMTAAERARLVAGVRADIERRRAEAGGAHTAAGVRRILDGIGRPEDVVAGTGVSVPQPRGHGPVESRPVERRFVGRRPAREAPEGGPAAGGGDTPRRQPKSPKHPKPPERSTAASPPHLAPAHELGPEESDPDWWREGPGAPRYAPGGRRPVGGFDGGVELPEVLEQPPDPEKEEKKEKERQEARRKAEAARAADADGGDETPAAPGRSRWARLPRPLRPRTAKAAGGAPRTARVPRVGGVVELAAAALLVAGAVMGSLIPLGLGWLAAWWSPRLSRQEAKWAVTVVPGTVAAAGLVWLWGRTEGRWGEPIAEGALGEAVTASWPWALRAAAVASALYLLWRARRPRG
ncbi:hypothetical protein IQ279_03990 [Streptomyces verrucosisporus]|uniref:hypothetical protein n=1 Tax=Streptomyces verrucosisporus TaxID=1695161 RepID=UPI0019D158C3|nr:hypothetical protein [Streptomyces verrucosisporus]MBN3928811.1 hypothetical protein [Streptomyces verrucosisporus]